MTPKRRAILRSILFAMCAGAGLVHAAPVATSPPDGRQLTAFFRAVQLDDDRTVKAMIGSVVNANQLNLLGGEPGLVLAVREDAMRVLEVFLAHPGTQLDAAAVNGNTP